MDSFLSALQKSFPLIAIFISMFLLLSTTILTFINQKPAKLQEPNKDEIFKEEETEEVEEEEAMTQVVQESQPIEEDLKRDTKSEDHEVNQVQIGPQKLHSCSSLSEDSDMEWQSREYSDDSISDEESLFEITLPNGQFVCSKQDENSNSNYFIMQQDFSTETVFYQPKLIELFTEINEEENLIEIDLSMGSIKCSRFEIEA